MIFWGNSRDELLKFPDEARREAGYQLHKVQVGLEPADFKPMTTVGLGVEEIRIREESGAFRVFYISPGLMRSSTCSTLFKRNRSRLLKRTSSWGRNGTEI
ncbi:MAG: type II toxin-antitoxin system RelE/ParE family toxin [Pyramidobacter sp.]|nr:type II toxin-antitoxin system RelE/ParE family toxin [Pyramidobacter sp.]